MNIIALMLGVMACSCAVIFIRMSEVHPILLAGYRTLLAGTFLLPVFFTALRKHKPGLTLRQWAHTLWPGLFLAVHFMSWAYGARLAPATNATLIVNTAPLAMPFFLYVLLKEVVNRQELMGTAIAFSGVVLLVGGDFHFSPDYLPGDVVCFSSMLLFACYLTLGRRSRHLFPSIWLYVCPVYFVCGLFCLSTAAVIGIPISPLPLREGLLMLSLALVPTITGHSLLNFAMHRLRGQIVSVANLGQFIFAGIMAYVRFGETPPPSFYLAAPLVLLGACVAIRPARRQRKKQEL